MRSIKGPAIFLAQFAGDAPPFNSLKPSPAGPRGSASKASRFPSWDRRLSTSPSGREPDYCDEINASWLSAPAGDRAVDASAGPAGRIPRTNRLSMPSRLPNVRGKPAARTAWALRTVKLAARAFARLGITEHATSRSALAWPTSIPGRSGQPV